MSENHYAEFSECSMKPQEVLEYVSGPIPVPEEGEVLVRMKAAPINPADINFRLARVLREEDREASRRYALDALAEAPRHREALRLLEQIHDATTTPRP